MKFLTSTLSASAACLLSISLLAQAKPTDLYVGVVDGKGEPVSGLGAADFRVREDNVAREVLKAGEATDQLSVALLLDDSEAMTPALQMIREAVDGFITALSGKAEIALITFGDRPTIVSEYATDTTRLLNAAHRVFPRPGSGAYLMDAIVEVSKGMQKRENKRRDIVVLTIDANVEFSNRHYQEVLDQLDKSGAALHVVSLGTPSSNQADEMRNRNQVIAIGTERTGGRRDNVLAFTGAAPRMKQLASELTHQYVVTYARPDTLIPSEKIEVTVRNPALTVHARTRSAQIGAR